MGRKGFDLLDCFCIDRYEGIEFFSIKNRDDNKDRIVIRNDRAYTHVRGARVRNECADRWVSLTVAAIVQRIRIRDRVSLHLTRPLSKSTA